MRTNYCGLISEQYLGQTVTVKAGYTAGATTAV